MPAGLELQNGIKVLNPRESNYLGGPWVGGTIGEAKTNAENNITSALKFPGFKVTLVAINTSLKPVPADYLYTGDLKDAVTDVQQYWFEKNQSGNLVLVNTGKFGAVAAGSTNEIQFNKDGALSASSGLTFDPTKSALTSSYVVATTGFSGSLTQLADGTSYLREGTNISITTGSGGWVTISSNGVEAAGSEGNVQFKQGTGLGADPSLTFGNGALTSSIFVATSGITGSLTQVSEGVPYLVALSSSVMAQTGGISISTGSNGQVSASYYVFPDDIRVALPADRYFGRYKDKDTIPAKGKTPAEIIKMATFYAVEPQINSFTLTPNSVPFNHGSTSITLNSSYEIKSYDGSLKKLNYLYQKSSNLSEAAPSNSWTTIYQGTTPPTTLTYSITDEALSRSKHWFRFEVTGSYDEASSTTSSITTSDYVTPSSTGLATGRYTQRYTGYVAGSEETFILRPKGNVSTGIGSTINFSSYVPVSSYSTEFSTDGGGSWTSLSSVGGISATYSPATDSPITVNSSINHVPSMGSSNNLKYRFKVNDANTNVTNPKIIYPANGSIVFDDVIFFGLAPGALGTQKFGITTSDLNTSVIEGIPNKIFLNKLNYLSPKQVSFSVSSVNDHNWLIAFPTNSGLTVDAINSKSNLGDNLNPTEISTTINFNPTNYTTNYTVWTINFYNGAVGAGETKIFNVRFKNAV